jgi:hypothetical protein
MAAEEHVVAFDASCACGEVIRGAWSPEELEAWVAEHFDEVEDA